MKIFIPSYKRARLLLQATLFYIPTNLYKDTIVVCRMEEWKEYASLVNSRCPGVTVLGVQCTGIASKRFEILKWCLQNAIPCFVMLDDDLQFFRRKDPSTTSLIKAAPIDMNSMFTMMRRYLATTPHVGISTRQGNNNVGVGSQDTLVEFNTRTIRAVGFRTEDYNSLKHCRIDGMEDLDATLQLLRQGKRNVNLYWWAQDQQMTNAPGGCSEWRTQELHTSNCHLLHSLHPAFVKVVEKKNKTGGAFGTRTEIRIQWKAAYEEGLKNVQRSRTKHQPAIL